MRSISIILIYYNRPQQLMVTMRSMELIYANTKDFEIIIVDDASDESMSAVNVLKGINLPLKIITVNKNEKKWVNPSVPFNIGIYSSTGDVVCIQPSECFHFGGNLVEYTRQNLDDNSYFSFSCYNTISEQHEALAKILTLSSYEFNKYIERLLYPLNNTKVQIPANSKINIWFNHPIFLPTRYQYFSCMTRDNMMKIGGFNESFAAGFAWEDDEFLFRIEEAGLNIKIIPPDVGFVVHQWHPKAFNNILPGGDLWIRNREIYRRIIGNKRRTHE